MGTYTMVVEIKKLGNMINTILRREPNGLTAKEITYAIRRSHLLDCDIHMVNSYLYTYKYDYRVTYIGNCPVWSLIYNSSNLIGNKGTNTPEFLVNTLVDSVVAALQTGIVNMSEKAYAEKLVSNFLRKKGQAVVNLIYQYLFQKGNEGNVESQFISCVQSITVKALNAYDIA